MDIPKQVQDKIAQYQNLQNQLQMVSLQKQQLMLAKTDLENASKEIDKISGEKVYRLVGPLLIETSKEAGVNYLKDESESTSAKTTLFEKQEKKLVEKLNEMRTDIEAMMKPPVA